MAKTAVVFGIFILLISTAGIYFLLRQRNETASVIVKETNIQTAAPLATPTPERDDNLQRQADALLTLFDKMPPVPVFVSDSPIEKGGTNTERGVAYTNCVDFKTPTITVKKSFYLKTNQKQITNILKHELTHAWQCRQGRMWGHDADFRKKFTEVGGFGN